MKKRGKTRGRSMAAMAGLIAWAACWPAYAFSESDPLRLKCVGERSDGFKTHIFINIGGRLEIRNRSNELVYDIQKDNGYGTPGDYSQDYEVLSERIVFHSRLISNKRMYTGGEINRKTGRISIETTEMANNFSGVCSVGSYVPDTKF
ncbi:MULTISPECIES: hypothetical protein [unclassified Pigmentiphaga]|uniref:hypothetical protein n=1 Tax=unclassified Pigmentiphaga TaxID=2626614 RepID=UPI0010467350|nr:hypothetical protein [Pigmentiphaga sp. D-2]